MNGSQALICPLPGHTIALVLEYLSPLALPFPPHLLSTALMQRHHFLDIKPENPESYLCWPSSSASSSLLLEVLGSLPRRADGGHASYPVRYTADEDSTYAHVLCFSPDVDEAARLVFQWDSADSWKYHDASTSPIPSPNFSSPSEALHFMASVSVPESKIVEGVQNPSEDAEDDYWNAYGGGDDADVDDAPRGSASTRSADKGEDAYWAQYASVHGTADSTIPSPVPEKGPKKPGPNRWYYGSETPTDAADAVRSGAESRAEPEPAPLPIPPHVPRENGAPPSPRVLRQLLETIPPRSLGASEVSRQNDAADPKRTTEDSEAHAAYAIPRPVPPALPILPIPPAQPILPIPPVTVALPVPPLRGAVSTEEVFSEAVPELERECSLSPTRSSRTPTPPLSSKLVPALRRVDGADGDSLAPEDEDVRQTIHGLFRLWSTNRFVRTGENGLHPDAFMQVVRNALFG